MDYRWYVYIGQLAREKYEEAQVEHNISSIQKDIMRLNTLITEKKGEQEELEHRTFILENDFIHALKVLSLYILYLHCNMIPLVTCDVLIFH